MENFELEKDERLIAIAAGACMSPSEVIEIFKRLSVEVQEIIRAFSNLIAPAFEALKEMAEYFEQANLEELDREHKRELHKLDFTRTKIRHQVLERKPRNLIKKII